MILRCAGRVYEIKPRGVTYETFRRVMQEQATHDRKRDTASLEAQLADLRELVAKESAKGPSRELRRLREKAGRTEKRIAGNGSGS